MNSYMTIGKYYSTYHNDVLIQAKNNRNLNYVVNYIVYNLSHNTNYKTKNIMLKYERSIQENIAFSRYKVKCEAREYNGLICLLSNSLMHIHNKQKISK